jgi:hypothetical protein
MTPSPTLVPSPTPDKGAGGGGSTSTPILTSRLATLAVPSKAPDLLPAPAQTETANTGLLVGGGLVGLALLITAGVIAYIASRR